MSPLYKLTLSALLCLLLIACESTAQPGQNGGEGEPNTHLPPDKLEQWERELDDAPHKAFHAAVMLLRSGNEAAYQVIDRSLSKVSQQNRIILLQAFRESDALMVLHSSEALQKRAFESIITVLGAEDEEVRKEAISSLVTIERPPPGKDSTSTVVYDGLERELTNRLKAARIRTTTEPPEVRWLESAVKALSRLSQVKRKISIMVEARSLCPLGLTTISQLLDQSLQSISGEKFETAGAWQKWWQANRDKTTEQILREKVAVLEAKLAEQTERLTTQLQRAEDEAYYWWQQHLKALKDNDETAWFEAVKEAARRPNLRIRKEAVRLLASTGREEALSLLMEDLQTGPEPIKMAVLRSLPDVKELFLAKPDYVDVVVKLLQPDTPGPVRLVAMQVSGVLGLEQAVLPLKAALERSEDDVTTVEALKALGRLGPDGEVGMAVLARLREERAREKPNRVIVTLAVQTLGQLRYPEGSPAIGSIVTELGQLLSQESDLSFYAARSLKNIQSPLAVEPLMERLGKPFAEEADQARQEIIQALGKSAAMAEPETKEQVWKELVRRYNEQGEASQAAIGLALSDIIRSVPEAQQLGLMETIVNELYTRKGLRATVRVLGLLPESPPEDAEQARIWRKLLQLKGRSLMELERWSEALSTFNRLKEFQANDRPLKKALARCYFETNEARLADTLLSELLHDATGEELNELWTLRLDFLERLQDREQGELTREIVAGIEGELPTPALQNRLAELKKKLASEGSAEEGGEGGQDEEGEAENP